MVQGSNVYQDNRQPGPSEYEPFQNEFENDHGEPDLGKKAIGDDENTPEPDVAASCCEHFFDSFDPNVWLMWDVDYDQDGTPHFDNGWRILNVLRFILYNPLAPEFTTLQQFSWSTLLGISIGVFTAVWKNAIEFCVEFVWKTVPERLYYWGVFSDLEGHFPLPHYMWICPSLFGGILSYIFCILRKPIPDQNKWIRDVHTKGVLEHETFWNLIFLSTAGMASGLSLGPELPLVLTAGMIGSRLAVVTRQSVLSARAINLTAASAAIAGFFGFPMAGALFVLEIPHRMGLQYFEALSPATFASIIAVIVNRMVLKNDVTGYYDYPFLSNTLPSHVFYIAICYGLVGSAMGVCYVEGVLKLKKIVHDWFHVHDDAETEAQNDTSFLGNGVTVDDGSSLEERKSLMYPDATRMTQTHRMEKNLKSKGLLPKIQLFSRRMLSMGIRHEPSRAAVAGSLAGFLTGVIGMFIPHVMFWGEAQLQVSKPL